jgi:hypothetical protein
MAKNPQDMLDTVAGPIGPYDAVSAEPWFLPDAGRAAMWEAPLPRAEGPSLVVLGDWRAAQGALAGELAGLAVLYGALEARLRGGPAGWRHRLALLEAADLSWALGDRIPADRLALWEVLHLSGAQDEPQGLERAAWALRRLESGLGAAGLAAFFGRQSGGGIEDVQQLSGLLADLDALHPVTRAVALGQVWQRAGEGGPAEGGAARQIEAAVLTGCLAAGMWPAGPGQPTGFVPQALGGGRLLLSGQVQGRLEQWLQGATRATQAALMHLDRVQAWQARGMAELAGLQGRTPAHLLAVLADWPLVSARLAARQTGASRATVLRNLGHLQARGLVREVTGQGRYRVWTAVV